MNFKNNLGNAYFLCSKQTFYIIRMPLGTGLGYFQVYIIIFFFLWLQRSIAQPKVIFLQISKNHNKKTDNQKKKIDKSTHFYLIISIS